ncbi:MAG: 3-beta hydroxysteroid dehydrogenase [Candidatus Sericytochromatia bacterium]|nr:MAG: 3-beta hydroxysteroid dehydrogenase [Candidatus Sericytochromatia bacterium]
MKNVLVTGANGFIGSNLCKFLNSKGYNVRALVLKNTSLKFIEDVNLEIFYGDISDNNSIKGSCRNIDTIFHLAAIAKDWGNKDIFFKVNVNGTENLLNQAVKENVKRFIFMSSIAVHKYSGYIDADENVEKNCSKNFYYGLSKSLAENIVNDFYINKKIETVIIRPGLFPFGPNDITSFLKLAHALESRKFLFVNSGKSLLSTAYIENLCYGLELAGLSNNASGNTYIISDDVKITWKELIEKFCKELSINSNFYSIPYWLANIFAVFIELFYKLFDLKVEPPLTRYRALIMKNDIHFSCNKAKKELKYKPIVSLDEGIKKTVQWYKSYNK